ncbi:MAG: ROK family protein, partial [Methanomicrobiales archaeon]|nr:ROK family protein [Methanomicrobiales archaeon]
MGTVIAVDLGGTWTRAGVVAGDGRILAERTAATPQGGGGPGVITEGIASLVRDLLGSGYPSPKAIGISAAGPVDIRRGALRNPPNLPFRDIPLVEPLATEFGLPV